MLSQLKQYVRSGLGCLAAVGAAASVTACGLGPDRKPPIRAADVARELTAASGIALTATPPPIGLPGLPELATTLSGGSRTEFLAALVFFERAGTERVLGWQRLLGRERALAGTTVLRRNNVVVIYRTSQSANDRSSTLRQALARLGSAR